MRQLPGRKRKNWGKIILVGMLSVFCGKDAFEAHEGAGVPQTSSRVRRIHSAGLAVSSQEPILESEGLSTSQVIVRKKGSYNASESPAAQEVATETKPEAPQQTEAKAPELQEASSKTPPSAKVPVRRPASKRFPQRRILPPKSIPASILVELEAPRNDVQGEISTDLTVTAPEDKQASRPAPSPVSVRTPVNIPVSELPSSPASVRASSRPSSASSIQPKESERPAFSGFYVGIAGGLGHLYASGSLYSESNMLIAETNLDNSNYRNHCNQLKSVYYGSYAENENTWLAEGSVFAGFDAAVFKRLRVGVEIQGAYGGRFMRFASNGVYGCRAKGEKIQEAFTNSISLGGRTDIEDVIFGYTRPKIRIPYSFTVTPRIGFPLFSGALLYTKFGIKYENYEITDTMEEDIEPTSYQKSGKKANDVIYDRTRPSLIGGIGLEALITKGIFLRLEGACSGGPDIHLDKSELKPDSADRTMEDLDITKMRNFYLGLGAGMRF